MTRSASSWWTQCEASERRSTRSRLGTSSWSGSASSGSRNWLAVAPKSPEWAPRPVKRRFGLLRRRPHRGAVVVDHAGCCAVLRPRTDVVIDLLKDIGRAGVAQEVSEEMPAVGVNHDLRQLRGREEEIPRPAELARVVQSLRQLPRVGRVEDRQPVLG